MHFKSRIALIFLTFFFFCFNAEGASIGKNWDRILDKYEALCNECIDMKSRVEAGEKISSKDISKLLNSLGKIREELKGGSGSMTHEQIERFESIRAAYTSAFAPQQEVVNSEETAEPSQDIRAEVRSQTSDKKSAEPKAVKQEPRAATVRRESEEPRAETAKREFKEIPQMAVMSSLVESRDRISIVIERTEISPRYEEQRTLSISTSAIVSVLPDPAYGLMITLAGRDAMWGGYAKFISNFKNTAYGYDCISTDESLWLSGNSSIALHQFSAGVTRRIGENFGAFAGMGYGSYTTTWEDSFGEWMRVTDHSTKGLLLEAGLSWTSGKVSFTGGVSITELHYTNLFLGIGLQF